MAVLSALAVPAFLLGAAIAEPPSGAHDTVRAESAPGRAALDAGPSASPAVSPAGKSRARDAAVAPAATSPPRNSGDVAARLTVRIVVPDGPFTTDELVRFRVRWSDGSGRYAGLTESWGDGTAASSAEVVSCTGQPGAHADELTTTHRFPAGRFRVRLTVATADCHGRTEERTAEVTIQVDAPTVEPQTDTQTSAPAQPSPSSEAPSPGPDASSGVPLPLPTVEPLVSP
ncbi:hypothetical protein [Cryptosporangium japonicum]|uniref:PKD domain-containing protein n=1 Tax=Cryptosporangium japonicum TaxID=80872 RepID=A0ABN0V720_9ACTN